MVGTVMTAVAGTSTAIATAIAAVTAAAITVAAPAGAEEPDDSFLETLGFMGIPTDDAATTVARAKALCVELDGGAPVLDVADRLGAASGLSDGQSAFFTGVSIGAYCPQHEHLLDEA